MRANWEKWTEDQIGVQIAGTPEELRGLADCLNLLSREPRQHFHITESGKGRSRVGDLEISVLDAPGDESMRIMSFAIAPGSEIPDQPEAKPRARRAGRTIAAVLLLIGAVVAALGAHVSQFVTVAGSDYRPVLTEGARSACIAFVLLLVAANVAKGWRLRLVALLFSFAVVAVMLGVVSRLTSLAVRL